MTASRQSGFLVIAAVFLVVVLAALVGYLMTTSTTSQAASAADQNSARAYQAARAGIEWALDLVLQNPSGNTFKGVCEPGPTTQTFTPGAPTLSGFSVTVTCSSAPYTEGGNTVRRYSITANACNNPNAGACPNNVTTSGTYIDREVSVSVTDQ